MEREKGVEEADETVTKWSPERCQERVFGEWGACIMRGTERSKLERDQVVDEVLDLEVEACA